MKSLLFLPALIAGFCLAAPLTGFSKHKRTYFRDQDGDGHYNKKTYDTGRHHRGYYGHRHGYYGGYYGSRYYGYPSYYGYGYPRHYGYGYGYGYPSVGISYTSRRYYDDYDSDRVYRGRTAARYSDSLAADVQSELRRRGYYRGSIDGDIGPGSRSAIRAYQADRGLSVTGRIDSSLLRSLGIG